MLKCYIEYAGKDKIHFYHKFSKSTQQIIEFRWNSGLAAKLAFCLALILTIKRPVLYVTSFLLLFFFFELTCCFEGFLSFSWSNSSCPKCLNNVEAIKAMVKNNNFQLDERGNSDITEDITWLQPAKLLRSKRSTSNLK